jgi:hypothetical protein
MKKIELNPTEFYFFRKLAFSMGITFLCTFVNSVYIIEASTSQLEQLGY